MRGCLYLVIILILLDVGCSPTNQGSRSQLEKALTDNGNERGNGADYVSPDNRSAWFLGSEKVIEYCLNVDSHFGKTTEELHALIDQSFLKWQTYIDFKRVNEDRDDQFKITSKGHYNPNCQDREIDLHFYFGSKDDKFQKLKGDLDSPLALSARTQPDLKTGWNKGVIWVASPMSIQKYFSKGKILVPDWRMSYALEGVILHELGHVFGCGHVSGTIMDQDIADWAIDSNEAVRFDHLTEIDGYKELALCDDCQRIFKGQTGSETTRTSTPRGAVNHNHVVEAFRLLMGRSPVGEVSAWVQMGREGKFLFLKDEENIEARSLEIHIYQAQSIPHALETSFIFRAIRLVDGDEEPGDNYYSIDGGYSASGFLPTFTGLNLPITFDRNMPDITYASPLNIRYTFNNQSKNLFSAQWHKLQLNIQGEMR